MAASITRQKLVRHRWLAAAAAVVVAVIAGAGVLGPSAPTAQAAPRGVTGGYVDWGVKASFRAYVLGPIANGSITLSGGATQNGDGTFRFPAVAGGSYDGDTDETSALFDGQVQFLGHGGLLDMTVSDIRVQIDGASGLLIADVVSRDLNTGVYNSYPDVEFADLDLSSVSPVEAGETVSWASIPATLTDDGSPAFMGFYAPGTALDPVSPTLTLEPLATLTWKVSQHAWTSSSLSPAHAAGAPAVKDVADGFIFPAFEGVTYDPATGATDFQFDGSLTLGNIVQGGYRIMLDNPKIVVDTAGNGELLADVSYCVSTAACLDPWIGPALGVPVTTFDFDRDALIVAGGEVAWTFTPHWATVGNQFAQEFLDALDASLRGHFRATGSGSDPNKPPAPITVIFDVALCGASDVDCDGFADTAATLHTGPANTNAGVDNCTGTYNYQQANGDGNYTDLPGKAYDDTSWGNSDAIGDVCDSDDDNDGLSDADEASGAACATFVTDPLLRDTDGDNFLDWAECIIGTDPTSLASKPASETLCGPPGDTDGDGVSDRREGCYYNTNPTVANTDGDACRDGKEMASINAASAVDVIDLQQVASEAGAYTLPGSPVKVNFDVTKNGSIDVIDLQQVAAQSGPCV